MAAVTRLGLYGGPRAPYAGFAAAAASITVTGTVLTEAQVVAGGETIVLTVANDTWAAFNDTIRQAIIDGATSAQSEAAGWNAEVRDKEVVGAIVRDSDNQVTWTLTAAAAFAITADEIITFTVPASALTGAAETVATPDVTVTATVTVTARRRQGGVKKRRLRNPRYPRRVSIDGVLHLVRSPQEERALLLAWQSRVDAAAAELVLEEAPPATVRAAKVKVVTVEKRIEKLETREADWLDRLRSDDDELLLLLN